MLKKFSETKKSWEGLGLVPIRGQTWVPRLQNTDPAFNPTRTGWGPLRPEAISFRNFLETAKKFRVVG
jgi:hypothetical protein